MRKTMDTQNTSTENHQIDTKDIKTEPLETEGDPVFQSFEQLQVYKDEALEIEETGLELAVQKYECNICDKICTHKSDFENHIKEHHQEDCNEKSVSSDCAIVYICEHPNCEKIFKNITKFKDHAAVHTNKRPFKCTFDGCSTTFKRKGDWKSHIIKHSLEKSFKCNREGCSSSFKTKKCLDAHLLMHSNKRPYKCNQMGCRKSFKRRGNLKCHIMLHCAERHYKCNREGCNNTFNSRKSLDIHLRLHSDVTPFFSGKDDEKAIHVKTYTSAPFVEKRLKKKLNKIEFVGVDQIKTEDE